MESSSGCPQLMRIWWRNCPLGEKIMPGAMLILCAIGEFLSFHTLVHSCRYSVLLPNNLSNIVQEYMRSSLI